MLKYSNLIERLSESRKIELLTDVTSVVSEDMAYLGLSKLNISSFGEYDDRYPSPAALANSWDRAIVYSVAEKVFGDMTESGVNMAIAPGAKIKLDPYMTAISEDPFLASEMSGGYVVAADKVKLPICMSDFSLCYDEIEWLDAKPDPRVLSEYVVKPFGNAAKKAGCKAFMVGDALHRDEYETVNYDLAAMGMKNTSAGFFVCQKASTATTVKYIQNGIICFEGSGTALESAVRRYAQIKRSVEKGSAAEEDLAIEVARGRAISPEALDEAVDRLLDFAFSVAQRSGGYTPSDKDADTVARTAAYNCGVLLQNRGKRLPLSKKKKVALLGDIGREGDADESRIAVRVENILLKKGYECIGNLRGYDISAQRSENLIKDAADLADQADAVIVFFGFDKKSGKNIFREQNPSLPANQCALAHSLLRNKEKVIAVVSSEYSFDITDVEGFAAVLTIPLASKYGAEATADIIAGDFEPCGRLASSLYRNTEYSFGKQKGYRMSGMKAGPFIGYRYYDTVDFNVGYPFGHGLGYTEKEYSSPHIKGTKLSVTVKNTGKKPCCTVVEAYIGKKASALMRPKKELAAFKKVYLEAKESKVVELELSIPMVYDSANGAFVTEKGEYIVYVGESVSDIRCTLKMTVGGSVLAADKEKRSMYLQSESNIISDKFTLEANYKLMKRSVKNIVCGSVLVALAVALQVYCSVAEVYALFLQIFSAALVAVAAVFFINEAIERNKIAKEERARVAKENEKHFEDAEKQEYFSAEQMFKDEFDAEPQTVEEHKKEADDSYDAEYFTYVDKDFSFADAAKEFERFAAEHGAKFASETVMDMFASMASSRLVVANGMGEEQFRSFVVLLGEYFETSAHIERTDDSFTSSERLLYSVDANNGSRNKTEFLTVLETAKNVRQNIHIAALTNLKGEVFANCFGEIVKYAKNPFGYNCIYAPNEKKVKTAYYIPKNVWIFVCPAEDMSFTDIPVSVLEVAAVTKAGFAPCEPQKSDEAQRKFKYYQMDYLTERVVNRFEVNEDQWKKVDRLTAFVDKNVPFSIGNKQWIGMERYASAYLACGGDMIDAVDRMLSARLAPTLSVVVSESDVSAELVSAVEEIFGEGTVDICSKALKEAEKKKIKNIE